MKKPMLALLAALAAACPCALASTDPAAQMLLGNPSGATNLPLNQNNFLLVRPQYALAYNEDGGRPNWVSWHLSKQDIGTQERGQFQPDTGLPPGFRRVRPSDYTRSGYDRGHHCPSKDRSAGRSDNDATFLMGNIMPQAPGNNQGPWAKLEDYCRDLTGQGKELYIVCGGGGGTRRIGRGAVTVPAFTWKVVVVLPEQAGDDLRRVSASTRVIAVRVPNISTVKNRAWRSSRVSVRDVERSTGYELLSNVARPVQDTIETRVDKQ